MWFLAALGPIGLAVAVVGTAATVYAATSSSDDGYDDDDKEERKAEAVKAAKQEKNNKIYQDIKAYKSKQTKRMKDKYGVDIKFHSGTSSIDQGIDSNALNTAPIVVVTETLEDMLKTSCSEKISVSKRDEVDRTAILEQETEEVIKLIEQLEVKKHEGTS